MKFLFNRKEIKMKIDKIIKNFKLFIRKIKLFKF